jgi:hypothetical protein
LEVPAPEVVVVAAKCSKLKQVVVMGIARFC